MTTPLDISGIADSILLSLVVLLFSVLIRRDATIRIMAVMLSLVSFSLFARLSGLIPLIRVVDLIISSAPIVLAIIFQNDLRRQLLSIGKRHGTTSSAPHDETAEAVEEILKALADMAGRHIGALIVVVRRQPIDHLVQIGTDIDAKVSSELLNSIFLPYSPIHDGAVIIDRGKITKAGCLLPLSHNPDIAKSCGPRHRAALGSSEATDALVLVVSEETGKISSVHESRITYDIELTELKRILKKSLEIRWSA